MFVVSFVGNRGTFIRGYKAMVMDMEFLYHVGYILTSVLGLFAHELFYSILVSLRCAVTGPSSPSLPRASSSPVQRRDQPDQATRTLVCNCERVCYCHVLEAQDDRS